MKKLGLLMLPLVAAGACVSYEKSENPLGPSVAGPIEGVTITQPLTLAPFQGSKVNVEEQPLTLVVENGASTGVRPVYYQFDVAADIEFSSMIFSRSDIKAGEGRTAVTLPDRLAPERTYYWRSRALDGANSSTFTAPVTFFVYTPIRLGRPDPRDPEGGGHPAQPRFIVGNASRSGPVGPMSYQIEVAEHESFGTLLAQWLVPERPGQTTLDSPIALPAGKQLFWRVQAYDSSTAGPWSVTRAFTVQPPVSSPGGGGSPSGRCGSVAQSTPLASIQAIRGCYPTPMSQAQLGELLNKVAWQHRGAGYGLHKKTGGHRCPLPGSSTEISCDILVHGPSQGVYDALGDAENAATPIWRYVGIINTMTNFVAPRQP